MATKKKKPNNPETQVEETQVEETQVEETSKPKHERVFLRAPRLGQLRHWMTSNGVCLVPPGMDQKELNDREVYVEPSGHHKFAWRLVGPVSGDMIVKPYLPTD